MMRVQRRLFALAAAVVFLFTQTRVAALADEATTPASAPVQTFGDGTHVIDASSLQASSAVVVSQGATALIDFGALSALTLPGDFINNGTVYFGSSNASVTAANLNAANIINNSGASLSSMLPAGGIAGFMSAVNNLSINLTAVQDIVNAGTISSAGNLSMVAGGSIVNSGAMTAAQNLNVTSMIGNIVNSGTMAALNGNLNIASATAQNLVVNNINGVMQALNGSINVRDALFSGKQNADLFGGDWLSKELNTHSGSGTVNMNVEKLTGTLNIDADVAHVLASTDTLKLGNIKLDGDPTFYNDNPLGDIEITGAINSGETLTIVATRNIFSSGSFTISANDGTDGKDINLIAGADIITAPPLEQSTEVSGSGTSGTWSGTGTPATATVTIDGASASGGNIDFSAGAMSINTQAPEDDANGGNIRLIAYADFSTGTNGGQILFASGSTISSSADGTGTNGDITIIAPNGIELGFVNTGTGNNSSGGDVTIGAYQPAFTAGPTMDFATNGTISNGNDFQLGTIGLGTIDLNNDITSKADVTINGGINADINIRGDIYATNANIFADGSGNITAFSSLTGATVSVGSNPGSPVFSPNGSFAYVPNFASDSVSVINTTTNLVVATVPVGVANGPRAIAITPNGDYVYVVNSNGSGGDGSVTVIQTSDNTVFDVIANTGQGEIKITSDGTTAYVVDQTNNRLTIIDLSSNTIVGDISGFSGPRGLALSPDGKLAYVGQIVPDNLAIVDLGQRTFFTIPILGFDPFAVAASPAGDKVYVSDTGSGNVTVIDTATNSAVTAITVGGTPLGVYFNSEGTLAYTLNLATSDISIINTATNQVQQTVTLPSASDSRFGQLVTNIGDNVVAYVPLGTAQVAVMELPTIVATNITLESVTGTITVATNAGAGLGQGISVPGGGSAFITEINAVRLQQSAVGGTFELGAYGTITVDGLLEATDIYLQNTLYNGSMIVNDTITAIATASLITVGPTSVIRQIQGVIEAVGGSLTIKAATLGGAIDDINLRSGATFSFDGDIVGDTVDIRTTDNNGNIVLAGDVTANTSVNLETDGSGQVLNKLSIADRIGVGDTPVASAISPDGQFVYVVNQLDGSVSVIDPNTGEVTATIPVGNNPVFVAFNRDSSFAYVANAGSNTITVIDTDDHSTTTVTDPNSDLNEPNAIAVTRDGLFAYVSNLGGDTVSVINLTTNTVVGDPIPVGDGPRGLALTPDGRFLYVANSLSSATVTVIQTSDNTFFADIPVAGPPQFLAANPNGRYVYATTSSGQTVDVIDTTIGDVVDSISLSQSPDSIAINPQGTLLYVPNTVGGAIDVFNTGNLALVDSVSMTSPTAYGNSIGIVDGHIVAYVPNSDSQHVSVVPMPVITTPDLNLTSTSGDFNVAVDITNFGLLHANTGGSAYVTGMTRTILGSSDVGGTYMVGILGNELAVTQLVTSTAGTMDLILQNATEGGKIFIGADITNANSVSMAAAMNFGGAEGIEVYNNLTIQSTGPQFYVAERFNLNSGALLDSGGTIDFYGPNELEILGTGGLLSAPGDTGMGTYGALRLNNGANWTFNIGGLQIGASALQGADNGTAELHFLDPLACVCLSAFDGGSIYIGADTPGTQTMITIDSPEFNVQVGLPDATLTVAANTNLETTGGIFFDLFDTNTFTNDGTIKSTASTGEPTISITGYFGPLTVSGVGVLDPGAGNSASVAAFESLVLANGMEQTVTSGDLQIGATDLHGQDNGEATFTVTGGGSIMVGAGCGCSVDNLDIRAVTDGEDTTINLNASMVALNVLDLNIHEGATLSTTGTYNIIMGDDSSTEYILTIDGILRQTGSGTLLIEMAPSDSLLLQGTGTIRQDAPTPGFTAIISDTQVLLDQGLDLDIQSASTFTSSPLYIDAPGLSALDSLSTATITTDGGAFSIAPDAGASSILFSQGTMNFNGGPLYVQAVNITVDPNTTVATNSYIGFIVTDDGDITNNGTIVATGSCAGCNGVNQFFLGFGDLDLFGTTGVFSPGTQGTAFTVNNGFQLSLADGLNWTMTSGGLAFFQGTVVRFGAGSLFQATNNATISVSSPAGSNLTVVLPDNATAELRNNGGILGIVPQTNGTSIFFNNSNLSSTNFATLLLNTTSAAGAIYIGTFPPGATNIAPLFNNVDINANPNPVIYFGTVNGLTKSIEDAAGEPSLAPALPPSGSEEDEKAVEGDGDEKANSDKSGEEKAEGGYKRVAYIHGGASPLEGTLTEKQVAADALLTGKVHLDGKTLAELTRRGVSAWQEGDSLRLDNGSLVLAPDHDVVVKTPEGEVRVDAGSAAYIMASGSMVAVYNLHDEHKHAVRVEVASETLAVHAGRHLVLTRNHLDGFGQVNPIVKLGYRQVKEHKVGNGLRAFQGEFSLVSALKTIGGARELLASTDANHKGLSDRLMKTAAIQAYLTVRNGAFASTK